MANTSAVELKSRKRKDYRYFEQHRTRWSDNDQYSHVNNSISYHLFDAIITSYLAQHCGAPMEIGLPVSSSCEYFYPVSFPDLLDLGLRVTRLGKSSVAYEVAIFLPGRDEPAVVGETTHVFVEKQSKRPLVDGMSIQLRDGLRNLFSQDARL